MRTPRSVARGLAAGQPGGTLAIPRALHVSARIAERDAGDFVCDATQLANALRDLIEAIGPDGVPGHRRRRVLLRRCAGAGSLLASEQLAAALEARRKAARVLRRRDRAGGGAARAGRHRRCGRRGRASRGGRRGRRPGARPGRKVLAAGADVLIVHDDGELPGTPLGTLANIARFHQALALALPAARYGLPAVAACGLRSPAHVPGVAVTSESLARDTDLAVLRDWVTAVRG